MAKKKSLHDKLRDIENRALAKKSVYEHTMSHREGEFFRIAETTDMKMVKPLVREALVDDKDKVLELGLWDIYPNGHPCIAVRGLYDKRNDKFYFWVSYYMMHDEFRVFKKIPKEQQEPFLWLFALPEDFTTGEVFDRAVASWVTKMRARKNPPMTIKIKYLMTPAGVKFGYTLALMDGGRMVETADFKAMTPSAMKKAYRSAVEWAKSRVAVSANPVERVTARVNPEHGLRSNVRLHAALMGILTAKASYDRNADYHLTLVRAINPKRMSQADEDTLQDLMVQYDPLHRGNPLTRDEQARVYRSAKADIRLSAKVKKELPIYAQQLKGMAVGKASVASKFGADHSDSDKIKISNRLYFKMAGLKKYSNPLTPRESANISKVAREHLKDSREHKSRGLQMFDAGTSAGLTEAISIARRNPHTKNFVIKTDAHLKELIKYLGKFPWNPHAVAMLVGIAEYPMSYIGKEIDITLLTKRESEARRRRGNPLTGGSETSGNRTHTETGSSGSGAASTGGDKNIGTSGTSRNRTSTQTGGSSPGGASTGGVGSGIGGAGTGGAATGGASTGGAGAVTITISGNSGETSVEKTGKGKSKGLNKNSPITINVSRVGGTTDAGDVESGSGPGAMGRGGRGSGSGGGGGGAAPDEPKSWEGGDRLDAGDSRRNPREFHDGHSILHDEKYRNMLIGEIYGMSRKGLSIYRGKPLKWFYQDFPYTALIYLGGGRYEASRIEGWHSPLESEEWIRFKFSTRKNPMPDRKRLKARIKYLVDANYRLYITRAITSPAMSKEIISLSAEYRRSFGGFSYQAGGRWVDEVPTTRRQKKSSAVVFGSQAWQDAKVSDIARRLADGEMLTKEDNIFLDIMEQMQKRHFGISEIPALRMHSKLVQRMQFARVSHPLRKQLMPSARLNPCGGRPDRGGRTRRNPPLPPMLQGATLVGQDAKAVEYVDVAKATAEGLQNPATPWRHDYKKGVKIYGHQDKRMVTLFSPNKKIWDYR